MLVESRRLNILLDFATSVFDEWFNGTKRKKRGWFGKCGIRVYKSEVSFRNFTIFIEVEISFGDFTIFIEVRNLIDIVKS